MKSLRNLLLISSLTISSVYAQTPSAQIAATEANYLIAGNFPGKSLPGNSFSLKYYTDKGYKSGFYNIPVISSVLSSGSCISGAPQWSIGGDNLSGLSLANKSIGTCDNEFFVLKSNNTDRLWISPNGCIGINRSSPMTALQISAPTVTTGLLEMSAGGGNMYINEKTQMIMGTTDQLVGDVVSIIHEDLNLGGFKIFSIDYQGNTKVNSVNTTVVKPAFSVQGVDLAEDPQDRIGSTFNIHGNQNGDVSSSADINFYHHPGRAFRIFAGTPTDGGAAMLGNNAVLRFAIDFNATTMTDLVTLGSINATNIPASNSALTILNSAQKAIAIYPKTGNAVASNANFVVFNNGSTSIGDAYVPSGYKLAVNGKIITEEVVVQFRNTWPDYVFQKDYKLKPLAEVEQYIVGHQHLQGIPSAKDIETEGVKLGDIVSKQMEKIEELTLYLIEQQKQIEHLKKEVESLKH